MSDETFNSSSPAPLIENNSSSSKALLPYASWIGPYDGRGSLERVLKRSKAFKAFLHNDASSREGLAVAGTSCLCQQTRQDLRSSQRIVSHLTPSIWMLRVTRKTHRIVMGTVDISFFLWEMEYAVGNALRFYAITVCEMTHVSWGPLRSTGLRTAKDMRLNKVI